MSNFQFDISKRVVVNIAKNAGIDGQKAKVIVCMDYSGSMGDMYQSGFVQNVVERLIPVAMAFDDDQAIEFYRFHQGVDKMPDVTLNNYQGYVKDVVMKGSMGYTNYSPALQLVVNDFVNDRNNVTKSSSGGGFFSKKVEGTVANIPAYVIFITDGNCGDRNETEKVIKEAANHGLFFQFIGIQSRWSEKFPFLEKLDTMSGRRIDNANFFEMRDSDLVGQNDQVLYSKLLGEFPQWVKEAKKEGIIK